MLKKIIINFGFGLMMWFMIHTIIITIDGLKDNIHKADCILILGNKVNENGTLSARLQSRVDKGIELYQLKLAPKIIVSGGLGKEGWYEAKEMQKYLLAKGVPLDAIIVDDKALTTYETACNFSAIAQQHSFHSVIVVSQFYHITRSKAMLESKGIEKVYTAHSNYYEWRDVYSVVRDFFAFYWFWIKQ